MSKPWKKPACQKCRGHAEVECGECGSTIDCDHCNGTGYDSEKVDVERWAVDVHQLTMETGSSRGVVVDGSIVGQESTKRRIMVADYPIGGVPK